MIRVVPREPGIELSVDVQTETLIFCSVTWNESYFVHEDGPKGVSPWTGLASLGGGKFVVAHPLKTVPPPGWQATDPQCSPELSVERYRIREGSTVLFTVEVRQMLGC